MITVSDWKQKRLRIKSLILGSLPLVIWHSFSVVYFGFLFPNTKYAKVGGRPFIDTARSGLAYLLDSAQAELHIWIFVIFLPFLLVLAFRSRVLSALHNRVLSALITGMYLQVIYVVFVAGGDFMRGRFFTVVALGASIALLFFRITLSKATSRVVIVSIGLFFVVSAWIGAKEHLKWTAFGVANERNFYKSTLALNLDPLQNYTNNAWARDAMSLASSTKGIIGVNGQRGYWIPRHINLIDPVALTDAFVARSPIDNSDRTGHFTHKIAEEYLIIKTEHHDVGEWKDKNAQLLYENLKTVTESPELFSYNRIKSMVWLWMNYGF